MYSLIALVSRASNAAVPGKFSEQWEIGLIGPHMYPQFELRSIPGRQPESARRKRSNGSQTTPRDRRAWQHGHEDGRTDTIRITAWHHLPILPPHSRVLMAVDISIRVDSRDHSKGEFPQ